MTTLRKTRLLILYYLIRRHYERFGELKGRKKLQKLMFLVEHLDPSTGRLTRSSGVTGYKFVIWLFGPFCKEIYDDVEELVNMKLVAEDIVSGESEPRYDNINLLTYEDDGTPKVMYIYKPTSTLRALWYMLRRKSLYAEPPGEAKHRIDFVIEKYGRLSATELERVVLNLLRLTPEKKQRYMGRLVDEYLVEEGLA